jgi:hypothetical protein
LAIVSPAVVADDLLEPNPRGAASRPQESCP